jgi:hypothetical protein
VTYNMVGEKTSNFSYTLPKWQLSQEPDYSAYYSSRNSPFANITNSTRTRPNQYAMQCPSYNYSSEPAGFADEAWFGYNWMDEDLNKTWWDHLKTDPWTSQQNYWKSWGFGPSNPSWFTCDTQNSVYQVRLLSLALSPPFHLHMSSGDSHSNGYSLPSLLIASGCLASGFSGWNAILTASFAKRDVV